MTDIAPQNQGPARITRGNHACTRERRSTVGGTGLAATSFSKDLSHDFRTPLNIIIGFSELLLEEIPGKLNEEQKLDLTDILNSGRRLLGLVNAMLERFEDESSQSPRTELNNSDGERL